MDKIFNDFSNDLINNKELAKLELHILAVGYLEEDLSHFTEELTKDNNEDKTDAKEPEVFDSKKEKEKENLWKE